VAGGSRTAERPTKRHARNVDNKYGIFSRHSRVEDGTFGTCIVDGGPIEERLEVEPWTPYCLKHAQRLEAAASSRTPTL
jgi:RNA polymerase-binding transcription factor DksA